MFYEGEWTGLTAFNTTSSSSSSNRFPRNQSNSPLMLALWKYGNPHQKCQSHQNGDGGYYKKEEDTILKVLKRVSINPNLSLTISEDIIWAPHINKITKKANSTLRFTRQILKRCPINRRTDNIALVGLRSISVGPTLLERHWSIQTHPSRRMLPASSVHDWRVQIHDSRQCLKTTQKV